MACFKYETYTSPGQLFHQTEGPMEEPILDRDLLAHHLRGKIDTDRLSIRRAATDIGCSAATLTRMLKGSEADNYPDTRNIFRAVSWLGKSIADFEPQQGTATSTLADVEVHLRALPELSEGDKEALLAMVKALRDAAVEVRSKKG